MKTHLTSDCVERCSGQWLHCTKDVLFLNGNDTFQFVTSIKDLGNHGRGKIKNLIKIEHANCTTTFMMNPLKLIFSDSIFEKPANDKYA